jgi:hypothetical protein
MEADDRADVVPGVPGPECLGVRRLEIDKGIEFLIQGDTDLLQCPGLPDRFRLWVGFLFHQTARLQIENRCKALLRIFLRLGLRPRWRKKETQGEAEDKDTYEDITLLHRLLIVYPNYFLK